MTKKRTGILIMLIGLALILCAAALIVYNRYTDDHAGSQAAAMLIQAEKSIQASAATASGQTSAAETSGEAATLTEAEQAHGSEMPTETVGGYTYIGTVEIPALGIKLPVLSEWDYADARVAPCRYKGSVYDGSLIIAGHNYKSHFGLLNTLSVGDTVLFTDMDGNTYSYAVSAFETIDKYDTAAMDAGDWDLTLFTCTIGGKQRVTVRCVRTDETSARG